MGQWQNEFTKYTTGTAFHLSLNQDQISLLLAIEANNYSDWRRTNGRADFIPVFRCLKRRGLAEHNPLAKTHSFTEKTAHRYRLKWIYRLTPAGEHVLSLVRLAGLAKDKSEPANAA